MVFQVEWRILNIPAALTCLKTTVRNFDASGPRAPFVTGSSQPDKPNTHQERMQRAGTLMRQVLCIERSALAPATLGISLLRPALPSKIHEPCGAHGTTPSRFSATAPGLSTRACGYRTPLSGGGSMLQWNTGGCIRRRNYSLQ